MISLSGDSRYGMPVPSVSHEEKVGSGHETSQPGHGPGPGGPRRL